ncbi:MAG: 2OG-Fe(II) oxygenase [Actinomycetota bacterium]|nr:2OG-Fe(II) oxygenase [Actinomycetota bacterium]
MTSPRPLCEVLANRRWVRRQLPFPHTVASNVFTAECYAELDTEFRRIETEHPEVFQRTMANYDAAGAELDHYRDGPLGLFLSREWHDLLASVGGARATGDVTASMHHHEPGSATGWPHHDYNPGWFADPPAGPNEVRLLADGQVGYHQGTRPSGVSARETIRAVSLLFYLANPEWEPGDGGETALFPNSVSAPAALVPPVNNSLVLFECTPFSWHTFISNRTKPRNSIVMWIHRSKDDAMARWGDLDLGRW